MQIRNIRLKDGTPCGSVHDAVAKFKCPGPCEPDCPLHPTRQIDGTDQYAHMCHTRLVEQYPLSALDAMGCSYEIVVGDEPQRQECWGAVLRSCAVRDVQFATTADAELINDDEWRDLPDAEVWLGFFYGAEDEAVEKAARYANTDQDNIRLFNIAAAMNGAPETEIRLRDAGPAGADCRNYTVTLPENATLAGFIEMIWQERRRESGRIYVSGNLAEASATNNVGVWEYENGMPVAEPDMREREIDAMKARRIRTVKASGGWGRMAWYVSLEPEAKHETEVQDGRNEDPA